MIACSVFMSATTYCHVEVAFSKNENTVGVFSSALSCRLSGCAEGTPEDHPSRLDLAGAAGIGADAESGRSPAGDDWTAVLALCDCIGCEAMTRVRQVKLSREEV